MVSVVLALLAALVFFLALVGVAIGSVDMLLLGLLFLSLSVASWWLPGHWRTRSRP